MHPVDIPSFLSFPHTGKPHYYCSRSNVSLSMYYSWAKLFLIIDDGDNNGVGNSSSSNNNNNNSINNNDESNSKSREQFVPTHVIIMNCFIMYRHGVLLEQSNNEWKPQESK